MESLDAVEGRPVDHAEEAEPGRRVGVGAHQPLPVRLQPSRRLGCDSIMGPPTGGDFCHQGALRKNMSL